MLATLIPFALRLTVIALGLAVGSRTTTRALRATRRLHAIVRRSLLVLLIGAPLLAFFTVSVLPLSPRAAAFFLLVALCPGAPMIFRAFRDRADLVLVVAIVAVVAPFLVAGCVPLVERVTGSELDIRPSLLAAIALQQVLPLVAGIAIAAVAPRAAAVVSRIAWYVFVAGFVLALIVVLAMGARALVTANQWSALAVLIITTGSLAMGHWAGRPRREDERAVATMAALGNPALGAAVVASLSPDVQTGALVAAYVIARALVLLPYTVVMKRKKPQWRPV